MCLQTFICLLLAYFFICLMCFSFMFNFSKTDVHICITDMFCLYIVLNVYYVMSHKFIAEKSYSAILTKFQHSTFFQWTQLQNECIPKVCGSRWVFSVNKKSPFLELQLVDKMRMSDLARRAYLF